MQQTLPERDVVLLGVGHTNAHVLRMWRMQPIPETRLTCVSDYSVATYSGMVPGVLSGQYSQERMEIDLVRLCVASGVRLIVDRVTGLDEQKRHLLFDNRPPLRFDVLSIGIGSVPKQAGVEIEGQALLPIKPMQTFLARLEQRLRCLRERIGERPLRIVIVGGGAGGVEIAFCLPKRIQSILEDPQFELTLVSADAEIVRGATGKTARRVRRLFDSRGVTLRLGERVASVSNAGVTLQSGEQIEADLVLWATSATAPPLLEQLGLPTDEDGFLLTRPTLQTVADAPIFAVGDTGTISGSQTPKAGVYAVRQGPVLWKNIQRFLDGRPRRAYHPQRGFLKLLNTGDGRSIAEYKGLSFRGRWCWSLKDWIDARFMDKYQDYRPMEMNSGTSRRSPAPVMRCVGCGGKVGGSILSNVLARLDIPSSEHILLGLDQPDDAAIVKPPGGRPMTVTADFFAAPLEDAYTVGRIAALNAASDVFALGARPLAALALVTLPVGSPRRQEELLHEVLAGSLHELRAMDAPLVGGHTIEGPRLTVGFTVLADQGEKPPRTKANLRAGDWLVLTKPLGSGILLAAHMRALCRAGWMDALMETMLTSNQAAAELLDEFNIGGVTDVTGFGLAGHLLEMLKAADVGAEIRLDAIPLLPGVRELTKRGIQSTLIQANRVAEAEFEHKTGQHASVAYRAMFDPQTCGGMLLGVPAAPDDDVEKADSERTPPATVQALIERFPRGHAAVIGRVTKAELGRPRIRTI